MQNFNAFHPHQVFNQTAQNFYSPGDGNFDVIEHSAHVDFSQQQRISTGMKGAQKINLKSPIGPGPNARQVYMPGGMQVNMGQI